MNITTTENQTPKIYLCLQNHSGFFGDANNVNEITEQSVREDKAFNWTVERAEVYSRFNGNFYPVPGKFNLVRSDNPSVSLGTQVSDSYQILQNTEMLDWLSPYLTRDYLSLKGYGYFGSGQKVFMQAYNKFSSKVAGDEIVNYFLISNAHGGGSIQLNFCTERVVCRNTLNMAMKQGNNIRIRHQSTMTDDLEAVKHRIDLAKNNFDSEIDIYNQLARKKMDKGQFFDVLCSQFASELKNREERARKKDTFAHPEDYPIIKHSMANWDMLPDLQHLEDTAWKGFQAFNFNLNHGHGAMESKACRNRLWGTGTYVKKMNEFKKLALV